MPSKPFNTTYKIIEQPTGKIVYLNGEQLSKLEILKEQKQVIFHTADGNTYTLTGDAAKRVIDLIEKEFVNKEG